MRSWHRTATIKNLANVCLPLQMSPCASSTVIIESDRVELGPYSVSCWTLSDFVAYRTFKWCRSNFKSLVEAATGIPIPHQKLFYGPGLLVLKDRPASEDVNGKSKSGRGDSVSDGKSTLATSVPARPAGVLEDNSKVKLV